jgi:hypothetical protein
MLAEIERQCVATGWSQESDTPLPAPSVTRHTFIKGNASRYVMVGQGMLSLAEVPRRQHD